MANAKSKLCQRLLSPYSQPLISVLVRSSCSLVCEFLSTPLIDLQHGASNLHTLPAQLRAARSIVRVANASDIGRVLDLGAVGVVVPMVNNKQQAEDLVYRAKYPPLGSRSWGPVRAHIASRDVHKLNTDVTAFAMIETKQGLDNLDEICQVEGLDGIYVGPYDLSISLQLPQPNPTASNMERIITEICSTATKHKIIPGIHCVDSDMLSRMAKIGFKFMTAGTDVDNMMAGFQHFVEAGKSRSTTTTATATTATTTRDQFEGLSSFGAPATKSPYFSTPWYLEAAREEELIGGGEVPTPADPAATDVLELATLHLADDSGGGLENADKKGI